MVNGVFEKSADNESSTSFEAFALTVAARVGTGNIVGVATAIAAGGPVWNRICILQPFELWHFAYNTAELHC